MRNATPTGSELLPLTRDELLLLMEGLVLLPHDAAAALLCRMTALRGPQAGFDAEETNNPYVQELSLDLTLCLVTGM